MSRWQCQKVQRIEKEGIRRAEAFPEHILTPKAFRGKWRRRESGFFDSIAIKNSKSRNLSFFTKRIQISSNVCILLCDPTVWSIEIILHSNLLHFSSRKMAITKRQRLPKKERDLTSCTEKNDLWAFLFPLVSAQQKNWVTRSMLHSLSCVI